MAIIVCPLAYVATLIEMRAPNRIVSLLDPQSRFPTAFGYAQNRHLRLGVHDITQEDRGLIAPAREHVQNVLAFVEDWDRADPILVHCFAGISRSTATAYTIACALNPDTDETEIAWSLRKASAAAWPNSRIIALADAELGRNGRMVQAVAAIGLGKSWEEIGENEPFEIPSRFGAP